MVLGLTSPQKEFGRYMVEEGHTHLAKNQMNLFCSYQA